MLSDAILRGMTEGQLNAYREEAKWISDWQGEYNESIKKLSDPEWVKGFMRSVEKRLEPLYTYDPTTDHGAVAAHIVGKVSESFDKSLTDFHFVLTFEERRERLREFINNIEEQVRREHSADAEDTDEL